MKDRADYFIAGTDTNVGKTHVTAALLAGLLAEGIDAVVMKPVQTGANSGRRSRNLSASPDLQFCARRAGWSIDAEELCDLNPYAFPMPASPHLAARNDRKNIDPRAILAAWQRLRSRHASVLVEGAGGLVVPLTDHYDQLELIAAMGLPVVLVARPGLGTLNHTLLSLEALAHRSIAVRAVVLSDFPTTRDRIAAENLAYLRERLEPLRILALPRIRRTPLWRAGRKLLRDLSAA